MSEGLPGLVTAATQRHGDGAAAEPASVSRTGVSARGPRLLRPGWPLCGPRPSCHRRVPGPRGVGGSGAAGGTELPARRMVQAAAGEAAGPSARPTGQRR